MTKAEYNRLYAAARRRFPRMTEYGMANIRAVYKQAAERLSGIILDAERRGLSDLTTQSWRQIQIQLEQAAEDIRAAIDEGTHSVVRLGARRFSKIHEDYLVNFASASAGRITATGIHNMVVAVDKRVVASIVNRVYQDGYTYSMRLWKAAGAYGQNMKNVITAGLAQGRDLREIAADVKLYAAKGRNALVKRYGDLLPGSRAFIRRIGKRVDYNALRILRSELYASMQDAARLQGQMNPGCDGWYAWIRGGSQDWGCECPDYAENSPYLLNDVPDYPHPNCHPSGTMILTSQGERPIEKIFPGEYIVSHDGFYDQVQQTWKILYTGKIINIDGLELTEDHLLFDGITWRPAHTFKPGDNIVRISSDIKPFSFVKSIANNNPSKTTKGCGFFRILTTFLGRRMPIAAIDFNGELYVSEGKIDIPRADGKVRERLFSFGDQGVIQHALIGRPNLSGVKLSYGGFMFRRLGPTPDGIVCGARIRYSTVGIASNMPFPDSGERKAKKDKISINARTTNSHNFSYLIHREVFVSEQINQSFAIQNNFSTHNSAIVSVSCQNVKNEIIYNLTTKRSHSFFANKIASHNCLCSVQPQLRPRAEFINDLRRWGAGERVEYLDNWYRDWY